MTSVLIAGATGLVGGLALELALADSRIERVVALTRRPVASHPGLRNVVIDFADLPTDADWWKVDGVICALGTTRARTPAPTSTGRSTGTTRSPSQASRAVMGRPGSRWCHRSAPIPGRAFAYTRGKGELERELTALGFPSLTIVRPSALDGRRETARLDERLSVAVLKVLAPILPSPWKPSSATAMAELLVEGAIAGEPGIAIKTNADVGSHPT